MGAFLERPIEGDWPYLWIDSTYVTTREAGPIVSVAVLVAVAVITAAQRKVRGMSVGPTEAAPVWQDVLPIPTTPGLPYGNACAVSHTVGAPAPSLGLADGRAGQGLVSQRVECTHIWFIVEEGRGHRV